MLEQICAFIHNFFISDDTGKAYGRHEGPMNIVDGGITLEGFENGDYFLISGSRRNDGIYQYPATTLKGTTLDGVVYEMRPPAAFLTVAAEIEAWNTRYAEAVSGPYQSESFGGYSYSLKNGSTASGGNNNTAAGWQGVFSTRLNQWRKLA